MPSRRTFLISILAIMAGFTAVAHGQAAPQTVTLIIDFGDGVKKSFSQIPWTKGMTVLDAMNLAKPMHGGFDFKSHGSGATTFLDSIDDAKNQGGGANNRNWQYWVNAQYAQQGFGVQTLDPLDIVYWKYDVDRGQ
jgi:hypothetical protein